MDIFKEIYAYRYMIASLVRKDLRGRYKGSVLGFLWTFINPLFQLIIYSFVFSVILRAGIDKFYLFLSVALIPWIFFSSSMTGGSTSILAHGSMVNKIYFPREVLPIAYVTSCFVNMLYSFIVIVVVIIIARVPINPIALLFLPAVMAIEYILALAVAFISSSVTVYFRDLEHILGIVSMAWMYLTPIMYPLDMVPEKYQTLFQLNPMTPVIMAYRDILYSGQIPKMATLVQALLSGVVLLIIGMLVFNKLKKHFAEEI
jgi:ABC-2 type transport system permease protein